MRSHSHPGTDPHHAGTPMIDLVDAHTALEAHTHAAERCAMRSTRGAPKERRHSRHRGRDTGARGHLDGATVNMDDDPLRHHAIALAGQ
jgi:hypothetical protein